MSVRAQLLARLAASSNAAVERVVEGLLGDAAPAEQTALADLLITRNRRTGYLALVRHFHRLPETLQSHLLENPKNLFGPMTDAMEDPTGAGRANVIAIVQQAADPKLVFLLTEALSDGREEVRQLAARSLLQALRKYRQTGSAVVDDTDLRRSLDFALRQFRVHHQLEVILAALVFERQQDSPLWSCFDDPHAELTRAASGVLRAFPEESVAGGMLLALTSPLKAAAVAGLSFCTNGVLGAAVARQAFRLVDPVVRAAAEAVARPRFLGEPTVGELPWTPETWLDFLRLVEQLGLAPELKLAWYQRLADTVPSGENGLAPRAAKMLLLRAIAAVEHPEAQKLVLPFSADTDEVVARYAARALLARRAPDWRAHAGNMLHSPHKSVRKLVSQATSPGQFDRLWSQYLKLPPAVQLSTTRALATGTRDFSDSLKTRLCAPEPPAVSQALRMLVSLPSPKAYREQIIALCGHADPRIVATAVRLIGRLEDPALQDLLEAAAQHPDARVRANAVEAMEMLHVADRSGQILALLNSRHHRERANAIKAISQFDFATARECLLRMLADSSPHHRVSALWVAAQLGLLDLVRQLGVMARRDPHARVRARAQELMTTVQAAANSAAGTAAGS